MKIKVCGMKYPANIAALAQLPIDYMGMILYAKSPRFFPDTANVDEKNKALSVLPSHIQKVGVVVNDTLDTVAKYINTFNLDYIQLHGTEDNVFCQRLKEKHPSITIIKAISVAEASDLEITKQYSKDVDYFLFDTKTPQHGGSGVKFDWKILEAYKGDIPFFLSGGISIEDAAQLKKTQHPQLYGIDINSRFETAPGLKDIPLIKEFITQLT